MVKGTIKNVRPLSGEWIEVDCLKEGASEATTYITKHKVAVGDFVQFEEGKTRPLKGFPNGKDLMKDPVKVEREKAAGQGRGEMAKQKSEASIATMLVSYAKDIVCEYTGRNRPTTDNEVLDRIRVISMGLANLAVELEEVIRLNRATSSETEVPF